MEEKNKKTLEKYKKSTNWYTVFATILGTLILNILIIFIPIIIFYKPIKKNVKKILMKVDDLDDIIKEIKKKMPIIDKNKINNLLSKVKYEE